MSTNLHIVGTRIITFVKPDGSLGEDLQRIKFDTWQTPTAVTRSAMISADQIGAYIEWILTMRQEQSVPIFAEDDIFGEGEPIGFETVCVADDHVQQLREWISESRDRGFKITCEAW